MLFRQPNLLTIGLALRLINFDPKHTRFLMVKQFKADLALRFI
jgi:hypothetical protein